MKSPPTHFILLSPLWISRLCRYSRIIFEMQVSAEPAGVSRGRGLPHAGPETGPGAAPATTGSSRPATGMHCIYRSSLLGLLVLLNTVAGEK